MQKTDRLPRVVELHPTLRTPTPERGHNAMDRTDWEPLTLFPVDYAMVLAVLPLFLPCQLPMAGLPDGYSQIFRS